VKFLKDILYKTRIEEVVGSTEVAVEDICFDSRNIREGGLFVAVKGTRSDGHEFIEQVISNGAIAIVCEDKPVTFAKNVTYVKVKDCSEALGFIASNFFDNPSSQLKITGITGTNGKTTTATLLHKLFRELGYHVGLLSTVCNKIDDEIIPSTHTTPDAIQLNSLLKQMVDHGCTYCFMEVSSHAVVQHRITGLDFAGAVFSNITHDHLDYHKTFAEYLAAKKKFFDDLGSHAFALLNVDDKNGKVMLQNSKAKQYTYALKTAADFKAKIIENRFTGLQLDIEGIDVWFKLVGSFNAYNLLAIYSTAVLLGIEKLDVLRVLSNLDAVEGRFEVLRSKNNLISIVDYAHTPDALNNVLNTISAVREGGSEEVITVVGCGGDRDHAKRPIMAKIACDNSNRVILTSDNPRSEDPETILNEMMKGVDIVSRRKVLSIANRKEAIKTACALAKPGDIILVAGKGHEKYQEIKGVKFPFDDKQIIKEIFEQIP
jgi:UDP-N-acetylmuramoyl-L-alanyl-D-glutamate--2,6-diaminopimelate ligase